MSKIFYTVLYDFNAEEDGELSVRADDVVQDTSFGNPSPDGWILVTDMTPLAAVGFVPKDYLSEPFSGNITSDNPDTSSYSSRSASGPRDSSKSEDSRGYTSGPQSSAASRQGASSDSTQPQPQASSTAQLPPPWATKQSDKPPSIVPPQAVETTLSPRPTAGSKPATSFAAQLSAQAQKMQSDTQKQQQRDAQQTLKNTLAQLKQQEQQQAAPASFSTPLPAKSNERQRQKAKVSDNFQTAPSGMAKPQPTTIQQTLGMDTGLTRSTSRDSISNVIAATRQLMSPPNTGQPSSSSSSPATKVNAFTKSVKAVLAANALKQPVQLLKSIPTKAPPLAPAAETENFVELTELLSQYFERLSGAREDNFAVHCEKLDEVAEGIKDAVAVSNDLITSLGQVSEFLDAEKKRILQNIDSERNADIANRSIRMGSIQ